MSQENDRSAVRERLGKLFSAPFEQHGDRWGVLWRQGDLPFDKGAPNPALTDTLLGKEDLVGKPVAVDDTGALRRRRALVPGCGRGYDVLWLASVGYEAYGLEVSSEAIRACEEFAATNFDIYARSATSEKGPGPFKFILGNFFRADWEAQLGTAYQGFDLIYDYTVSLQSYLSTSIRTLIRFSFCRRFPQNQDLAGRHAWQNCLTLPKQAD